MASVSFTFNGNYDPDNTVTLLTDPVMLVPDRNSFVSLGPQTGTMNYVILAISDPSHGVGFLLFEGTSSTAVHATTHSVHADFSDNTASVYLDGGNFGDVLRGGSAADMIGGGGGNDILEGGAGGDALSGGAGFDTASYEHAGGAVNVFLDPTMWGSMLGDAAGDTFSSIENIRGSAYADTLWGDSGNNVIEGGAGGDVMWGGGGSDTLSYASSGAGVAVSLADGSAFGGDADGDLFLGFANLRGSLLDDVLTGDDNANTVDGMGSSGPLGDALYGLAGDDRLIVRGDPAMVDGGADFDTVVIAAGATVTFAAGTLLNVEAMSIQAGASVDLSAIATTPGTITASGDAAIVATSAADRIILSAGTHTVTGGGGADKMFAGTGADTFVFDAGWGRDTVYRIDTASDHLDLSALGLSLDDLTVRTASNGLDTLIYETGNNADWIVLKGVLLDKAAMPDGFLIL